MKKIKIFIASSAELNEDKQMFDLYFSDKNKLYRDRNIDFDQRTKAVCRIAIMTISVNVIL